VALCLDLLIRDETRGRKSLDDVMRALWRRHGLSGIGVDEDGIERIAEEATGLRLQAYFDAWLRSTRELPLARLLAAHGVKLELRPAQSEADKGGSPARAVRAGAARPALGVRTRIEGKDVVVTHVLDGGAAQDAGLAAGDTIVAMDGLRPGRGLDAALAARRPGERVAIVAFRRDELMSFKARLRRALADTCVLSPMRGARAARLDGWLGRSG